MCFTDENNKFRDKFPPEAAGQRKGQVFHQIQVIQVDPILAFPFKVWFLL